MKLEFKTEVLKEFKDLFEGSRYESLKSSILTIILRQKDLLFKNSVDPDGKKWEPLAPLTIKSKIRKNAKITSDKKKQKKFKILVDTGNLKNSLTVQGGQESIQETSGDEIVVGTNVEYAAIHNFGGSIQKKNAVEFTEREENMIFIPARPFIGIGVQDENQIAEKISSYIDKYSEIA